jgi:hypothetical protein
MAKKKLVTGFEIVLFRADVAKLLNKTHKMQIIREYIVYKAVINCKYGTGHRHLSFCKKWSGTRRERTVIFGHKTGIHNLRFGVILLNINTYVMCCLCR